MVPTKATITAKDVLADGSVRYRVDCQFDNKRTLAIDVHLTAAEETAANTDALLASSIRAKCPTPWSGTAFPVVKTPGTTIALARASLTKPGAEAATTSQLVRDE